MQRYEKSMKIDNCPMIFDFNGTGIENHNSYTKKGHSHAPNPS